MTSERKITPELIRKHGLTDEEYQRVKSILGREPNITELGIFSVMWSEHCSYKNSRVELKKFPTTGPRVLVKAGDENAGVIDIGDDWAIAFKIESHNHPSAVEPFQGAATGVGGIIRDIFTMGARPVLCMDSLRFGPISTLDSVVAAKNRRLLAGVVAGISHYGNCIGLPTVGGEIYFDESYNGNPLVNVVCLGVLRHDQIRKGRATGTGNPVYYVGAATGKDGLAGAAFASRELTEASREDRPAVQVGDPFMEKLLLEACLELFAHPEAVVGVQDMGAAGLTCSTCETASRGNSGIEIELDHVPQRETGMTPYEIMLSESQERMLIIVRKGHEGEVERIFQKWDLHAARIGFVTDDGRMRVKQGGETVAEIPAKPLAEEAPVYTREVRPPMASTVFDFRPTAFEEPLDYGEALLQLLNNPTIASKNWVYRQYDHQVRASTCVLPGSDAAVVRLLLDELQAPNLKPLTSHLSPLTKYLALTTDCNAIYCRINPRQGAKMVVAEACRNIVCSGGTPLACSDNLNFGNPYKPEIFWQFRECVEGMAEACRFFKTPVTGGNVSFYNESPHGAVDPTPVLCMAGLIEDPKFITTQWFKDDGDLIFLMGKMGSGLGGSQYLLQRTGKKIGPLPILDLEAEKRAQDAVAAAIRKGIVRSAHDCSEGGFAVAAVECCVSGEKPRGASVDIPPAVIRLDDMLFNESPSRVIVSVAPENAASLDRICAGLGVPLARIGHVGGLKFHLKAGGCEVFNEDLDRLHNAWRHSLAKCMDPDSQAPHRKA